MASDCGSILKLGKEQDEIQSKRRFHPPKRYIIAMVTFLGVANLYCLRANLSIAIVEMTKKKNVLEENGTYINVAEFNWDSKVKGFILSVFSYGYCFCPLGGKIASCFGGATIFGLGIALTACITLLTPFLVHLNFYLFIFSRILEGLLEGFSKVSYSELWSRWAPEKERSKLIAFSCSGLYMGTMFSFSVAGLIARTWGWQAIFYVTGGLALCWYILWFSIVYDDPSEDKYISIEERVYITENLNHKPNKKVVYMWKDIATSKPVWAICFSGFIFCVGYSVSYLCLPQLIQDISHMNINMIGFISSIPHLCAMIAHPIAGILGDFLRNKKVLTITQVHKLFLCGGFSIAASTFLICGLWMKCLPVIICFSVFRFFTSFSEVALQVMVIDLSPAHAGLLSGVSTTTGNIGSIVSPILIGYIVTTHSSSEWSICFIVIGFVYVIGAIVFYIFGSGERQPWAYVNERVSQGKQFSSKNTKFHQNTVLQNIG